ncbi:MULTISPECIES: acyl carrier protein [unclassified Micromonospora]|jgi:acyl carrier protein|uniref:acyl carrier protein n=1 Tax=unclassified Micromonospora TaxID=2617518 RepID=UPI00103431EC|nr:MULTISPECIES: acyl carrier protein [unclassified Micromonospora]QKW11545.1 acyl carrier protein [Verrucosispora sp. NA02020]QKW11669.1 acyl carrier protein [Verrucosispora sp. NA02020]TBL41987.1 acyl carrier protein [Verrucosispora sp. SN26_14.1]
MTETIVQGQPPAPVVDEAVVASVRTALAAVLKRDVATITPDTRLFDDLGLDSTSVLELLLELENELGAEFDPDDLEQRHFETVTTLSEYVNEHVSR